MALTELFSNSTIDALITGSQNPSISLGSLRTKGFDITKQYNQLTSTNVPSHYQDFLKREEMFESLMFLPLMQTERYATARERRNINSLIIGAYWLFVGGGYETLIEDYRKKHRWVTRRAQRKVVKDYLQRIEDRVRIEETNDLGITNGFEFESDHYDEVIKVALMQECKANIPFQESQDEQVVALRHSLYEAESLLLGALNLSLGDAYVATQEGIPVIAALRHLHAITSNLTSQEIELRTHPSIGFWTQIIDLMHIFRSLPIEDIISMHQTIGGIALSKEHTEVMDIRAITIGAGFSAGIEEMTTKSIRIGNEWIYFPFFAPKTQANLETYPENASANTAVEFRSYEPLEALSVVRIGLFNYLSSAAIHAVQKDPAKRTERDNLLISAWETMMQEWNGLLFEYGLENPKNEAGGRWYANQNPYSFDTSSPHGYIHFVKNIAYYAQNNRTFMKRSRVLMHTFESKVLSLIQ